MEFNTTINTQYGVLINGDLEIVDRDNLLVANEQEFSQILAEIDKDDALSEDRKAWQKIEAKEVYDYKKKYLESTKPIVYTDMPILGEFESPESYYEEDADNIYLKYRSRGIDEYHIRNRIAELSEYLHLTDYKIYKNTEYRDAGLPLPYEPKALHEERQPYRDEINRLESLLISIQHETKTSTN